MAAGHPALQGPLGNGSTPVGKRTLKLGYWQGENNPWLVPRLGDSRICESQGLGNSSSRTTGEGHSEQGEETPEAALGAQAAVQLVPGAHAPGRCRLHGDCSIRAEGAKGCVLDFLLRVHPEMCLCSFYLMEQVVYRSSLIFERC